VLNPATVTLAFLGFGFPAAAWPDLPLPVAWAAIPAALIGMVAGVMPARIVLSAALVGGLAYWIGLPVGPVLPAAGIALVLLVADPVASASTRAGGWLNGLLYGALMVLFAVQWQQTAPLQMAVSAALLVSLAAPLLDEIAIAAWLAGRKRRHG
jgi:Na+-transporting NADH:ubiquinone oxidoreductase subunit B